MTPAPILKMTDIHTHLVPAVDDGAENLEMALIMLMSARDQGITHVLTTPHSSAFTYDSEHTMAQFRLLRDTVARMLPGIKLYPGCEVYCEVERMEGICTRLKDGTYPTMNGTKFVLMEFSQWVSPDRTLPCVQALVQAGYVPIIAHAERYRNLVDNMELIDSFRGIGARIQINAYSLAEEGSQSILNWARRLVLEKKVDFLGTDAHRTYHRPPSARSGLEWLYENVDSAYADAIATLNAQHLLELN